MLVDDCSDSKPLKVRRAQRNSCFASCTSCFVTELVAQFAGLDTGMGWRASAVPVLVRYQQRPHQQ